MTSPGNGNLEERVKRIKRKVAILDDAESYRKLLERYLRRSGDADNLELEFLSTADPGAIVEAATKDTSIEVVIADLFLQKTPLEMKSRFENGLDVLRMVKDVRGSSVHNVLISGIDAMSEKNRRIIVGLLGRRYIQSLAEATHVDASWEKSGRPEDMRKLYEILKKGVLKHKDPKYNWLQVITGESGTGKSSLAWNLGKRVPNLEVFASDTTKKPRPSELLGPEVPVLYQRITHNYHPTHESLHDTIMKMSNPLIWTSERGVLTKEQYRTVYDALSHENDFRDLDFYALDLEAIDKCLEEERDDALILTPFLDVVKYLRNRYGNRCLVTCLEADEFSRTEWMRKEGRSPSEILNRIGLERMLKSKYHGISDMIIDTSYSSTLSVDPDYNRKRAIDQVASRVSKIVEISGETPHGTTAKDMCIAYASGIEEKLAALTKEKTQKLERGQTIEFQDETMVSFNREKSSDDTTLMIGRMAWLSQAKVTGLERGEDGTYVHLVAKDVVNVPEQARNEELWRKGLKDVFSFYLSNEGYKAAATSTFHSKIHKGLETVSLLFALDDYNYCIQLIFD